MMPLRLRWAAPICGLILLLAVVMGACGKSPPSTAPMPSSPAVITIVSPTPGQVVTGTTLHVVLTLTGATLVSPNTQSGVSPTQGHIHLLDNGSIISMTSGLEQDISVTPGSHLLEAEFVANNHVPFSPRDKVSVHFTAQ